MQTQYVSNVANKNYFYEGTNETPVKKLLQFVPIHMGGLLKYTLF